MRFTLSPNVARFAVSPKRVNNGFLACSPPTFSPFFALE